MPADCTVGPTGESLDSFQQGTCSGPRHGRRAAADQLAFDLELGAAKAALPFSAGSAPVVMPPAEDVVFQELCTTATLQSLRDLLVRLWVAWPPGDGQEDKAGRATPPRARLYAAEATGVICPEDDARQWSGSAAKSACERTVGAGEILEAEAEMSEAQIPKYPEAGGSGLSGELPRTRGEG